MRIVFFGSSRHVIPIVEMLYNNFDLPLVVTTEQGSMDPVPFYCEAKKIEYISIRKSADLLSSYPVSQAMGSIGVVADFGLILPKQTLDTFPLGVLNVHPSLLPLYRGPSPVQNTILNGERETGVTIIKLDKNVDHGPVLGQIKEEVKTNDTSQTLYERLFKESVELLSKVLIEYENSQANLVPQKHEDATFTKMLTREDGFIDFTNFFTGKDFFERMIRAYYPWPGVWTRVNLTEKKDDLKLLKFLPNKLVQVEGGREMQYKDFINGYPKANETLIGFLKKDI
jgi:methionyl-tRNA formyltransferase